MSEPEPVDEEPGGAVEVRGGDRPQNWQFPEYDSEGTFPRLPEDDEGE
jgi:hypothetical protein